MYRYNPAFFILSAEESTETFPKHNGFVTISESFANCLLHYNANSNNISFYLQ